MYSCSFGTAFRSGYVGILSEVKFFMNRFYKPNFVGRLFFQGSKDGKTYTTIFTVGQEIHEGWNYYDFAVGLEPRYRYYRFFGSGMGSCIVGEMSIRGIEAINSTVNLYQC